VAALSVVKQEPAPPNAAPCPERARCLTHGHADNRGDLVAGSQLQIHLSALVENRLKQARRIRHFSLAARDDIGSIMPPKLFP
jgi:hypothetical protein